MGNNSQLIDTFAKTVLIVIQLGFIHAIFLLPVLLITTNRFIMLVKRTFETTKTVPVIEEKKTQEVIASGA
ncbi:hypothetical protein L596_022612 [Steinernema carpocapsae]|uniref:Uncharacterized protein n=1 Tax=Steinernema carpocapsae TaxID=34508 RepID=A0A4U5MM94_STECR|nr:hypothetical protein L596_022612 [Steinernema carpocapsae]